MSQLQSIPILNRFVKDDNPSNNDANKSPSYGKWGLGLAIVAAIVVFYLTGLHEYFSWEVIKANLDSWKRQVDENIVLTAAIFFAIYVVVTALSLPAAVVLTLVAGALFGRCARHRDR